MSIALALPAETFARPEIVYAVADVLDAASKGKLQDYESTIFWELFDATLLAAAMDPDNAEVPEDRGWISLSINRSMGRLATAFLARLFARGLKVGDGIPKDLVSRFNLLLSPGSDPACTSLAVLSRLLHVDGGVLATKATRSLRSAFDRPQPLRPP